MLLLITFQGANVRLGLASSKSQPLLSAEVVPPEAQCAFRRDCATSTTREWGGGGHSKYWKFCTPGFENLILKRRWKKTLSTLMHVGENGSHFCQTLKHFFSMYTPPFKSTPGTSGHHRHSVFSLMSSRFSDRLLLHSSIISRLRKSLVSWGPYRLLFFWIRFR